MEIENKLTCSDAQGRMDQSCPAWDHNVALGVACATTHDEAAAALEHQLQAGRPRALRSSVMRRGGGVRDGVGLGEPGGFAGELARYITPFRRRVGHWLTPASTMMPLLTDPSKRKCTFSLANPGWVNDFKLRFSGDAATDGAPPAHTTTLFQGGNFDSAYNDNRTLLIAPPVPLAAPRKVELAAIISGHGNMEFLPSTHTFEVNGVAFSTTSEGVAGTGMGCSTHVRDGRAQPNEHGTWYTGRNFWCNGADVPVHSFDVTAAVVKRAPVNVTYYAHGPGGGAPGSHGGGSIVLSSVLAWTV